MLRSLNTNKKNPPPPPQAPLLLWTLEMSLRGNVIIHKAPKAIDGDDCCPPTSEVLAKVSPARSYPGLFRVGGLRVRRLVFRTEGLAAGEV